MTKTEFKREYSFARYVRRVSPRNAWYELVASAPLPVLSALARSDSPWRKSGRASDSWTCAAESEYGREGICRIVP